MSFKIFMLQLTGKIRDTEKIEAAGKTLQEQYLAFQEAARSEELREFQQLEKWVSSGEYDRKKKEIEALVFKGSLEFNQLKEFNSLRKNKPVRNFLATASSADLKKFQGLEGSDRLNLFRDLKDYVKDGQYHNDKKNLLSQTFKGSPEEGHLHELAQIVNSKMFKAYLRLKGSTELEKHIRFGKNGKLSRFSELKNAPEKDKAARQEFKKLKNDPEIRDWFKFEQSKDLKYYHEMAGSPTLARLEELQKLTGTPEFKKRVEFLKDTQKLDKSEFQAKYNRFRELEASEDIRFYHSFGKSSHYRNYLDMKDSYPLKRYYELKELTSSAEFLQRKAYLEDSGKWQKTEEYARYQKYLQLRKDPKVLHYLKFEKSNAFDFLKEWEISFEDHFPGKVLDTAKWTANSYWADRLVGDNYSQPGDLQAYTGGKNVRVDQNRLSVLVKKEKADGKRWLPAQGFVPDTFNYTSDTLSTCRSFSQKEGIFEARIRFNPCRQVVQSFHLSGESVSPQVTLMEAGPASRAGLFEYPTAGKPLFRGVDLKNLKKGMDYIFRLEWNKNHLRWKINDTPVFETDVPELKGELHLNLTSLVIDEVDSTRLPVAFEISWVKCYRKKN